MGNTVTKQITFPMELLKVLEPKAKRYGYTFPGYVRYVLTKDMEKEFEKKKIEEFEKSLAKGVENSVKEYEEGKGIALDSDEAIDNFFNTLHDEE
jgi:wyosine [tRNA(Phe)-imidazoG37] synthetase (radical SAM superfamily)